MDVEKWRDQYEELALYKLTAASGHDLGKFLQSGVGNRIVTTKQARLLTVLRMVAVSKGDTWKWLKDLCNWCEDYQLTVGVPVNSRSQYLDAIKFERAAEHEKSRFISMMPTSGGTSK